MLGVQAIPQPGHMHPGTGTAATVPPHGVHSPQAASGYSPQVGSFHGQPAVPGGQYIYQIE